MFIVEVPEFKVKLFVVRTFQFPWVLKLTIEEPSVKARTLELALLKSLMFKV